MSFVFTDIFSPEAHIAFIFQLLVLKTDNESEYANDLMPQNGWHTTFNRVI